MSLRSKPLWQCRSCETVFCPDAGGSAIRASPPSCPLRVASLQSAVAVSIQRAIFQLVSFAYDRGHRQECLYHTLKRTRPRSQKRLCHISLMPSSKTDDYFTVEGRSEMLRAGSLCAISGNALPNSRDYARNQKHNQQVGSDPRRKKLVHLSKSASL